MVVTTLPLAVNKNKAFGTLMPPFVASIFSKHNGCRFVLSQNCLGRKYHKISKAEMLNISNWHIEEILKLGIGPEFVWNELLDSYLSFVKNRLAELLGANLVTKESAELLRCECGIVEMLSGFAHCSYSHRTFIVHGGKIICRFCHKPALPTKTRSLLFNFPQVFPQQKLLSGMAGLELEIETLKVVYSGTRKLISRQRPFNIQIEVGGELFHIDTDFFWGLFISHIAKLFGESEITVVTGNRTIWQAVEVSVINSLVNQHLQINLLIHPVIKLVDNNGNAVKWSIEEFFSLDERVLTLRFFLSQALKWNSKEVVIPTSSIYWIKHSVFPSYQIVSEPMVGQNPGENFFATCNNVNTQSLIQKLRKKKILFPVEYTLYDLLKQ